MKAYIRGFKTRAAADHAITDYWFALTPKDAAHYSLKGLAEADIRIFGRGITINEDLQRPHMITEFEIEDFEDGFVVACEGSFVIRGSGEAQSKVADIPSAPSSPRP